MSQTIRRLFRFFPIALIVGGLTAFIGGAIAWGAASTQLSDQRINVAGEGEDARYASGPFAALSQIDLIQEHTAGGVVTRGFEEGTVYTDVPRPDSAKLAECLTIKPDERSPDCKIQIRNDETRSYLDNSNFKQASLYTAVMAFGVSLFVMAVGLALGVIGLLFFMMVSAQSKKLEEASA